MAATDWIADVNKEIEVAVRVESTRRDLTDEECLALGPYEWIAYAQQQVWVTMSLDVHAESLALSELERLWLEFADVKALRAAGGLA